MEESKQIITEKEINLLYSIINAELDTMDQSTSQSWIDILQMLESNIIENEEDNDIQS
jgi:uncharacterized protein YfbU (UPF0304 family)